MTVSSNPSASAASPFGVASRLRNRSQIDAVKQCASQAGRYTVMVIRKTPPDGERRAAFLISRRFDRLAVRRNRARRLFRECWRRLFPCLAPCWVLMIPRKSLKGAKLAEVLPEVESALKRAGVLHEAPCQEISTILPGAPARE